MSLLALHARLATASGESPSGSSAGSFADAIARAGSATGGTDLIAPAAAQPFIAALLADAVAGADLGDAGVVLAVTSSVAEAENLAIGVEDLLGPGSSAVFPGWETLPHERLSPSADTVGQRIAVLRSLSTGVDRPRVVTAPVRAVLQPFIADLASIIHHDNTI